MPPCLDISPPSLCADLAEAPGFLASFLADVPPAQVLIVTGPSSWHRSGASAWFATHCSGHGPLFDDFSPNPQELDLLRGIDLFRAHSIRAVIAVGGGSAIDMAKLIAFFAPNHYTLDDFLAAAIPPSACSAPVLAIPTTAGTGAEATHFSVLYRDHKKYSVAHPAIRPSHVWLAPAFTTSLPPYQTACTGMDALAQGIESFWAKGATPQSRAYALEAIPLALAHLRSAVLAPTPDDRAAMLRAAHLAGQAIDLSKTTAPHAFSYILTSTYHLPHGHAVALLLPHFIDYHAAHGVTVPGITGDAIRALMADIRLPSTLPAAPAELADLLLSHVNLGRLSNNPLPVPSALVSSVARALTCPPSTLTANA
ncbi:MAG: phosphonoacetaldehyde reductase [Kiritimatiellae bacterium]|nr:phosphonoacetaldehyde reductase [Kiritimatiellia bacterium]